MLWFLAGNLSLIALALIFIVPRKVMRYRLSDLWRIVAKYRFYIALLLAIMAFHIFEVRVLDAPASALMSGILGDDGLAPLFHYMENGLAASMSSYWSMPAVVFFVSFYFLFHLFLLWFIPLLFLLNNKTWHTRMALLAYPVMYAMSLPFYLFLPVTNVYTYRGIPSPVEMVFPGVEKFYYSVTTVDNCFPSLHVGVAFVILGIVLLSDNRRLKPIAIAYAILMSVTVIFLSIHWVMDVLGGIAVAAATLAICYALTNPKSRILRMIRPTRRGEKLLRGVCAEVDGAVNAEITARGLPAKTVVVGSIAKKTHLRDSLDLDLFLQFPKETPREKLGEWGIDIGKTVLPAWELRYAEHPYVAGSYKGLEVDIVPCYEIEHSMERISAVDRTPLHTHYVRTHLRKGQRDEVRLLKQFLKGIGAYGAETSIGGFSGYLCELLILRYGSFDRLLAAASLEWTAHSTTIKLVDGASPDFDDPLTFIDPVDPNRNVAAALSEYNFELFRRAAAAYLTEPALDFFLPKSLEPWPLETIRDSLSERGTGFVGARMAKPEGIVSDTLYPQARKGARNLSTFLENHGFEVAACDFHVDDTRGEVTFVAELATACLPETKIHEGPPSKTKAHAERFFARWENDPRTVGGPYEKGGRYYVEVMREYPCAKGLLDNKGGEINFGKNLRQEARERGLEILDLQELLEERYASFWTRILEKKEVWEF